MCKHFNVKNRVKKVKYNDYLSICANEIDLKQKILIVL